jgi:hypothetical protein
MRVCVIKYKLKTNWERDGVIITDSYMMNKSQYNSFMSRSKETMRINRRIYDSDGITQYNGKNVRRFIGYFDINHKHTFTIKNIEVEFNKHRRKEILNELIN